MSIKRFVVAGAMGLLIASGSVQASDPKLDASSREALMESSQVMLEEATREDQGLFLTAVDVVSIDHALTVMEEEYSEAERESMDISMLSREDGDKVIERTRESLNGKTLQEVIDMASSEKYLEARMTVAMLSEKMQAAQKAAQQAPEASGEKNQQP